MADATITIGGDINDLKRRLKEAGGEIKSFGDRAKTSVGSIALGGLVAGGTVAAVMAVMGGVKRLGAAVADSVISLDSLKRGLEAVEGSSKLTEDRMDSLRKVAALPGLGFEESIQGFVGLRSVGLDANLAEQALIEMGNALAVVGKGKTDLDGVLLALTQIVSKGKVSAEEINQIAERVPQVRAVMKDVFGTADTEALQKMNITAEDFIQRLVDGFEKEVPRASKSLQSSLDNTADSWNAIRAQVGSVVIPELVGAMEYFAKQVEINMAVASDVLGYYNEEVNMLLMTYEVIKASAKEMNPFINEDEMRMWTVAKKKITDYLEALEKMSKARALADLVGVTEDPSASMEEKQAALIKYQDFIKNKSKVGPEEGKKEGPKIEQDIAKAKADALRIAREMENVDRMREQLGEREFQRILKHMTPLLQVEAIQKRIAQEKERQANEEGPRSEGETLENQKRLVDLEDQLAEAVRRRGEAQVTAAREAADAAEDAAEKTQALMDVEKELALLEAQAAGKKKEAAAIEREMAVEQTKRAIMSQTGLGEEEALKMAEKMQKLREKADAREEKERVGGPSKTKGYSFAEQGDRKDKQGSLLDGYNRMQQDRRLGETFQFPGLEAYRKLQEKGPMGGERQNPAEALAAKNAKEAASGKDLGSRMDKLIEVTTRGLLGE